MSNVPVENLIKQCPDIFKLVLGAAERANELNEGAAPLVKSNFKKVTTIALEEIAAGCVKIDPDKGKKSKTKKGE